MGPEQDHAAVAIVLDPQGDLLFIRRATRAGDPWSGHVAFPGGRAEPGDADLVATAAREAHEELGLELHPAELLGQLDDLFAVGVRRGPRPLLIRPYVWAIGHRPVLRPNAEVHQAFWWPMGHLAALQDREIKPWVHSGQAIQLPAVRLGSHELWGLSLAMIDDLLRRMGVQPPVVPLTPNEPV
jgi:8-oxo-dGTP pyrophosphatase MutT (NUDIX family)